MDLSVVTSVILCMCFKFQYQLWATEIDEGRIPEGIQALMEELGALKQEK